MKITIDSQGDSKVAVIESAEILIGGAQDALDLMATVGYEHECHKLLLDKKNIAEAFFDLRTGIAGEILQKYTNYQVKLAIVGDFGSYGSKSLRDLIYESNQGNQVAFLEDRAAALAMLHRAK